MATPRDPPPAVDPTPAGGGAEISGLSGFSALRDLDAAPLEFGLQGKAVRAPQPWQRMPLAKRLYLVPYLFLLVWVDYARRLFLGLRWLVRQWLKARPGAVVQVAETLAWPVFFVALGWLAKPDNPFFINDGFPWPWLGVWLIALRYGVGSGIAAALLLLLAWYGLSGGGGFPRLYFLGGAIVTLITGEFGSLWGSRAQRQREAMRYLDEKIDRLTRRLYLLKLSHDELEYEMVERPGTLRDALSELHARLQLNLDSSKLPSAQDMMAFLAAYGQIESGGLYEYVDGPRPKIKRVAKVGDPPELNADDPMVRRAIETGQNVHLLEQLTHVSLGEQVMVVCPMFNDQQDPTGLLAINRLPFMAFNADNLRNIGVLVQAYSEYMRLRGFGGRWLRDWPLAPATLLHEFAWLERVRLQHGIDSACLFWQASGPQANDLLEMVRELSSHGTMAWRFGHGAQQCVVTLAPFVTARRMRAQEELMRQTIQTRLKLSSTADLLCESHALGQHDVWATIKARAGVVS